MKIVARNIWPKPGIETARVNDISINKRKEGILKVHSNMHKNDTGRIERTEKTSHCKSRAFSMKTPNRNKPNFLKPPPP